MTMDVKLLEAFRAVMENRSVTGAAKILGVTQPAVSAQLNRLESIVGFRLFDREGGRLKPSAEGKAFYEEVKHALGMIDRLHISAERIRSHETGTLVIAAHPSGSTAILPDILARFCLARPYIDVRMINRTSEEVRSVFEANSVDIGLAEVPVDLVGVQKRRYAIECVAILPEGHPLAEDRDMLDVRELSGLPFVCMTLSRAVGHRIRSAVVEAGATFNKIVEAEYFSTICALVANGLGVSIVDYWSAQSCEHLGLRIRRLRIPITYEIAVFHSAERPLGKPARDLLLMIDEKLKAHGTLMEEYL
ncbi:LysR family transcriptional regulator [Marivibrio halodurans]|uniref:LysR family transcriptional regulator n=1 Tax=Marivibrio halodurans TaxID=2039722 RepID=A0A8J7V2U0_9PROT|nr:LysR substrate-binding domain-containing protein [Marivibrio halodurans]MBP5857516.1 LysR family transcriptional regulator [Marivibrio halodurans]